MLTSSVCPRFFQFDFFNSIYLKFYLKEDEVTSRPLSSSIRFLMQVARHSVVKPGFLREHQNLRVIYPNGPLHLRGEHDVVHPLPKGPAEGPLHFR
jgi:hypothetical protein